MENKVKSGFSGDLWTFATLTTSFHLYRRVKELICLHCFSKVVLIFPPSVHAVVLCKRVQLEGILAPDQ